MDRLLYLLPVVACPVAMGVMMWMMMRGKPLNGDERAELNRRRAAAARTAPAAGERDRDVRDDRSRP